jgi:hypothetical protein
MSCRFQQSDRLDSLCSRTQADALPPDQSLSSLPLESADRGLQASSAHSKPNQRAESLQNHAARSSFLTSLQRTNGAHTHHTSPQLHVAAHEQSRHLPPLEEKTRHPNNADCCQIYKTGNSPWRFLVAITRTRSHKNLMADAPAHITRLDACKQGSAAAPQQYMTAKDCRECSL